MAMQFQPTAQNMVQEVKNIIEGYRMGALRALAQDPVQNSLDARDGTSVVRVEYELHVRRSRSGELLYMLTVTDSGTTGLTGEILTPEDLQRRRYQLSEGHNWSAFEAQGFTKSSSDKLGSRGQGKSAFLYQSEVPFFESDDDEERMLIMYDSLLSDGEYRLGVRFASPADVVGIPPFFGEEARDIVSSDFYAVSADIDPDLEVPLGLEPLDEVGTRVIVPFLRLDTVEALLNGTLEKWLERCWWRPIQKGRLEVSLILPSGVTSSVGVPTWWEGEPWNGETDENVVEFRNLPIGGGTGFEIDRLVFLHDEGLDKPEELHSTIPEYSGIQLLRHDQWVETLGAKQDFPDIVPYAYRDQFRGFVEFNDALNAKLRSIEDPQHDSFDGRVNEIKGIRATIESRLRQFARAQGWPIADEAGRDGSDTTDSDVMADILTSFIAPLSPREAVLSDSSSSYGDPAVRTKWKLDFNLTYPREGYRVNWDDDITGLRVNCEHSPSDRELSANVRFQLKPPGGRYRSIQQRHVRTSGGKASLLFDNFRVVSSKSGTDTSSELVECPARGKYMLQAVVVWNGDVVASKSLPMFVEEDPPDAPLGASQSVSIVIMNKTTGVDLTSIPSRIRDGDVVEVVVRGRNRDFGMVHCDLNVSVITRESDRSRLLANEQEHALPAALPGTSGELANLFRGEYQIFTVEPSVPIEDSNYLVLPAGRHRISADLFVVGSDAAPAHASKNIYVEIDPTRSHSNLPFGFEVVDTASAPLWDLREEPIESGEWVLSYNRSHSLYGETVGKSGTLKSMRAFYGHICVEALIDWAMIPYLERRDESNLELLRGAADRFKNMDLRERYLDSLQRMVDELGGNADPSEYVLVANTCRRSLGGIMNTVLRQQEG